MLTHNNIITINITTQGYKYIRSKTLDKMTTGGGTMMIYVKIWRVGAIVVDCQKGFGFIPVCRVDHFGEEWIISLPYTECIWTPERVLKRDKKIDDTHTKNSSGDGIDISRTLECAAPSGSGIPTSICDLPHGNCGKRGNIVDSPRGTNGPSPVDGLSDCGRPVNSTPKWRGVWPGHPQNFPTGTAPKGTVPDT